MKLYVALSILDREEWSGSTVCSAAAGAFELVLRNCLRNEGGEGKIAAHASLYFTGADEQMKMQNKLFYRGGWTGPKEDFFLDILYDEPNTVSYASDPASWYARWKAGTVVKLYEVIDVDDDQVRAAHRAVLDLMASGRAYDPTLNINSLFARECVEVPCGCCFCCCQCWAWKECKCCVIRGITCISGVLVGLAATRGASENDAERALGLASRATLAARLPRDMVEELIRADVVSVFPVRLEVARAFGPSQMERF